MEEATKPKILIEPTEDEKRNGWTAESLTAYMAERERASTVKIDPHGEARKRRPVRANSRYDPMRWR